MSRMQIMPLEASHFDTSLSVNYQEYKHDRRQNFWEGNTPQSFNDRT